MPHTAQRRQATLQINDLSQCQITQHSCQRRPAPLEHTSEPNQHVTMYVQICILIGSHDASNCMIDYTGQQMEACVERRRYDLFRRCCIWVVAQRQTAHAQCHGQTNVANLYIDTPTRTGVFTGYFFCQNQRVTTESSAETP